MSEQRKYNTDALFIFPLVGDGVADFVTDYTPAAGDAKLWSDTQISTNLTAFILGFDSLSEKPNPGDQIDENGAGTAQAVIMATVIVSGTVGGGDAAGFFFVRSVSGQAWSNNDQIDINGGTANIATADSTTYDLAATAGLIGDMGNGRFAAGLTPTELSCKQGDLRIVDSATKAIEDQAILFETYGNASAMHAFDFDAATQDVNVTQVSGDSTAADNLEADYDGTGYDKSSSTIGTTTANTDMRGTDSAATATNLAIIFDLLDTEIAAILAAVITNAAGVDIAADIIALQADLDNGTDGLGALKSLIDTVNSDLANGTDGLGALKTLIDALNSGILTTALTESYAADGSTATLTQLLYLILAIVGEFSISGTTITAKKLDGSTTAATFTINDATNPTSRTRVT